MTRSKRTLAEVDLNAGLRAQHTKSVMNSHATGKENATNELQDKTKEDLEYML